MTITHRSQNSISTQRDSWIEINLSALERNVRKIKDIVKTDIMAVVKADAYGHGSTTLAPLLEKLGINSFGVATVDEGISLRNCGVKIPILILGATPFWAYEECIENDISITIFSLDQISKIEETIPHKKITCELKIDTGMNRLGIATDELSEALKLINNSSSINLTGIFSHLSDVRNKDFSLKQKDLFDSAIRNSSENINGIKKYIANSYAAINYSDFRYDLVRIGIGLYGQEYDFLEPLISVKGRITNIHKIKAGDCVSYDRTWQAKEDSVIATIPIGYADGVSRGLSNKIYGTYKGQEIKQVGNITMDQMMFDITNIKDAKVSDIITLIDEKHTISNWAKILNTITWELICGLKIRLPRVYVRD